MKIITLIFCLLALAGCGIQSALKNDSRVQVYKVAEGSFFIIRLPNYQSGFATGVTSSADITDWSPRDACYRVETRVIAATRKAVRCPGVSFTLNTFGAIHVFLTK